MRDDSRPENLTTRIRAHALTRRFADRAVLDALDFAADAGEFIVLLGRSGTGKSTLLRLIGGLDEPSSGELTVQGELAMAFQDARLLPWQKVWQNVTFGLKLPRRAARERAREMLQEVGLAEKMDAWPLTLSGGEAQRVSLARALARNPGILLLDEPFGALDALTRLTMQELVVNLWQRHRPTAVMVTHDVAEAVQLGQRILVLDSGRIIVDTTIDAPYPRSAKDPALLDLRDQLLTTLGVNTESLTS
ncbi:ABC transporter ATP-binding protein [Gulosibacter chungangensis]|uniref:ABC transporter ATP-binding protein n=1 Tax=Gulosibacter chungangensis TaxID=979746 RepID=A0A7J5BCL1_9MICO|nr:ABC transporter ATP-binding protein [Gulosibacter chungangensis]KAB1643920.1 ABC transporter ATP-binding protein [Gulosibacter chungangensis]